MACITLSCNYIYSSELALSLRNTGGEGLGLFFFSFIIPVVICKRCSKMVIE